jgi:hypothetical protein
MTTIDIDKVDLRDTRFCISYPLDDHLLLKSVRQFGVLMPLALLGTEPYTIVTGFKRIQAAKKLGMVRLPCVFLSVDDRTALLTAITDNMTRTLNTIEKAHAIKKMLDLGFQREDLVPVLELLGIKARAGAIDTLAAVACLETPVKDFIVSCRLPLNVAEQMAWFSAGERERIIGITTCLNVTVSYLREVLQLLMLSKVKQDRIDFAGLEGTRSMEELKQRLRAMVNPALSALGLRLSEIAKQCRLPQNIRVEVDPGFEREWIDVRIKARSPEEVGTAVTKLGDLVKIGVFRSIFDLTNGSPNRN